MENIRKLYNLLGKRKQYYLWASLLMLLSIFIRMLEPKILQVAVDNVIGFFQADEGATITQGDWVVRTIFVFLPEFSLENLNYILLLLGVIFLVVAFLRGITMFVASAVVADSTEKSMKTLRDKLFFHIQKLPLAELSRLPRGELIQRCTGDIDTVRQFLMTQVVEVIRLGAVFFIAFYMMTLVHFTYALISIALVPLISITGYLFFLNERKVWTQHEAEQDKLSAIVEENISGNRVVKAFAAGDFEIEKFKRQNDRKRAIGLKHVNLHAWFWPASDILVHLQLALSIFFGGYYTLTQQITVGELVSFYTYAIMVTWPMRQVGRIVSQMGMATVAIQRVNKILDIPPETDEGEIPPEGRLKGEIEFRNVSFKYNDEEGYVLRNISFRIEPGEKVAFAGRTGSGKSTVIQLLNRFYEPDEGKILLDGKDIRSYPKNWLRSRIGMVLQNPFLFSTSVKANISYVNPAVDDVKILENARAANIHKVLETFRDGYETVVGEKGITLSGGQKQRVALARTLLSEPDILVLDDTTSAVDTETEIGIRMALRQKMKGRTSIIIAHRIASIEDAGKIFVLDKGRIAESGTHDELITGNGYYAYIFKVQQSIESDIESEMDELRN